MRQPAFTTYMLVGLGVLLTLTLVASRAGCAEESAPQEGVGGFIQTLVGEWVGTCVQSTNSEATDKRYFHAVVTQSGPDTYRAVFEYFRPHPRTQAPVSVGVTVMTTTVAADGTATNVITGTGEVLVDPKTSKPELHELSERLSITPSGSMEGAGGGSIEVSGMPLGLGKRGTVREYRSAWSLANGVLTMRQSLNASFKVLFFSKTFTIVANYVAQPGNDISGLMKIAEGAPSPVIPGALP
jgi:hypothetical protein